MSRAARVFALVFAAGLAALLCVGLVERRSEAFTLGVKPVTPLYARGGSTVCQGPIEVVEDFSAVRLTIGAAVVSSPPARVEVLDARPAGGSRAGRCARATRPRRSRCAWISLQSAPDGGSGSVST